MATIVGQAIIGGLLFGASALLRKKPKPTPFDNRETTLTQKGAVLPLVFGRRRLAPIFCWAGSRRVETTEVDGGSGVGGDVPGPNDYWEGGLHALCLGPVKALRRILENGKTIYDDVIERDSTVSGSTFDTPASTFSIYWGEKDQPISSYLARPRRLNISSRFPGICYIVWHPKHLGAMPTWKNLEFDIEYDVPDSPLTESASWMEESEVGAADVGVNPAHVLWQLMTGPYPYGLGISTDYLDGDAFEALGGKFEEEHTPCNMIIGNGEYAHEAIQRLMSDFGFVIRQKGGVLQPFAVREPCEDMPVISADMMVDPEPEQTRLHGAEAERYNFNITSDNGNNFKATPILTDNDGIARLYDKVHSETVDLTTVGDRITGQVVANRKTLELSTEAMQFQFRANRAARYLYPGDPFILENVGQMRLTQRQFDWESPEVQINCLLDQYSAEPGAYEPPEDPEVETQNFAVAADLVVRVFQVPDDLVVPAGSIQLMVLRVRAHERIVGADVWISTDNVTYTKTGSQDYACPGGTLNSFILDTDPDPLSPEVSITDYNTDLETVPTLSADQWDDGLQLAVIDDEVFYLQGVTAESGGYELDGMQREKEGTTAATHATEASVITFQRKNIVPQSSAQFIAGRTIYVKTQPKTSTADMDLSLVTPVTIVLV